MTGRSWQKTPPWTDSIAVSLHHPHLAFASTCEVLWWISNLDELLERRLGSRYIEERKEHHIGDQLMGLRYARNRLTHKLDILELVEPGGNLKDAAFGTPGYWKWCSLPAEGRTGNPGESEYGRFIAEHKVQSILTMVLTFLRMRHDLGDQGGTCRASFLTVH